MRGLSAEERDLLTPKHREYSTEREWCVVLPVLVQCGRMTYETRSGVRGGTSTAMGRLALRVCPVDES